MQIRLYVVTTEGCVSQLLAMLRYLRDIPWLTSPKSWQLWLRSSSVARKLMLSGQHGLKMSLSGVCCSQLQSSLKSSFIKATGWQDRQHRYCRGAANLCHAMHFVTYDCNIRSVGLDSKTGCASEFESMPLWDII